MSVDRTPYWPPPVPEGDGLPPDKRLLAGQLRDAVALAVGGTATPADIDTAMRLGAGYPRGPFAVLDALGEDAAPFAPGIPPAATGLDPPEAGTATSAWPLVGVVGTGHMATGIVESVLRSGRRAVLLGRSPASLGRASGQLGTSLEKSLAKDRITRAEFDRCLDSLETTTTAADLALVDIVIEAVTEELPAKNDVFLELDEALADSVPIASNTSSLRIDEIAGKVTGRRPLLGLHFFNPAPIMKLVEVISGPGTGDDVVETALAWVRSLGKTPIRCRDSRGFVVNRLLIPFLNDAVRAHEAGVPVAEIDELMRRDAGHPMGPFALLDLIGLDITIAALNSMAEAEPDPRLTPAKTLYELVGQGRLGRKSGRGFYHYGAP